MQNERRFFFPYIIWNRSPLRGKNDSLYSRFEKRKGGVLSGRLEIGKQIACLRKQKGITQDQLAGMVGVSAGAVSKWETGISLK